MKPQDLKRLIDGKRRWTEPLTPEDQAKGFKGWYSSKYLPHFDSPGAQPRRGISATKILAKESAATLRRWSITTCRRSALSL